MRTLQRPTTMHTNYHTTLAGHNLGAGVAAVVTSLLNSRYCVVPCSIMVNKQQVRYDAAQCYVQTVILSLTVVV